MDEKPGLFKCLDKNVVDMIMLTITEYRYISCLRSTCRWFRNYWKPTGQHCDEVLVNAEICGALAREEDNLVKYIFENIIRIDRADVIFFSNYSTIMEAILKRGSYSMLRYVFDTMDWSYPSVESILRNCPSGCEILEKSIPLFLNYKKIVTSYFIQNDCFSLRIAMWAVENKIITKRWFIDECNKPDVHTGLNWMQLAMYFCKPNSTFWLKMQHLKRKDMQGDTARDLSVIAIMEHCQKVYHSVCFKPKYANLHEKVRHICGCPPTNKRIKV